MPVSSCTTSWPASRSASASVRCSPCDAWVRASSPSIVKLPLVAVRPDQRDAAIDLGAPAGRPARRAADPSIVVDVADAERLRRPLGFVRLHRRDSSARRPAPRTRRRPPAPAARRAADGRARARRADCTSCSSNTSSVACARRRRERPLRNSALRCFSTRSKSPPRRVVARREHAEELVEVRRGAAPGPSFTSSRSSGANTVTRNRPCRSRARVTRCLLHRTRLRPVARISASNSCVAIAAHDLGAHDRLRRVPLRTSARVGRHHGTSRLPRDPADRFEHARLALPVGAVEHREPGIQLEIDALETPEVGRARGARLAWSSESRARRASASGGAHRHQQVQEVAAVGRAQRRRLERVDRLERDLVGCRPRRRRRAGTPG